MRANVHLPIALQARMKQVEDGTVKDLNAEMRNVNALYSLLGDRYKAKVCCNVSSHSISCTRGIVLIVVLLCAVSGVPRIHATNLKTYLLRRPDQGAG